MRITHQSQITARIRELNCINALKVCKEKCISILCKNIINAWSACSIGCARAARHRQHPLRKTFAKIFDGSLHFSLFADQCFAYTHASVCISISKKKVHKLKSITRARAYKRNASKWNTKLRATGVNGSVRICKNSVYLKWSPAGFVYGHFFGHTCEWLCMCDLCETKWQ